MEEENLSRQNPLMTQLETYIEDITSVPNIDKFQSAAYNSEESKDSHAKPNLGRAANQN